MKLTLSTHCSNLMRHHLENILYIQGVPRNMTMLRRLESRLNIEFLCDIQSSTY